MHRKWIENRGREPGTQLGPLDWGKATTVGAGSDKEEGAGFGTV